MNEEQSFMPDAPPNPRAVSINEVIDVAQFGNNLIRIAKVVDRHIALAAPCIALKNWKLASSN